MTIFKSESKMKSLLVLTALCSLAFAQPPADNFAGHPRAVIISDIGNEPDDQMSLVRLLLYSNEIDIEALIAGTSTWQKAIVHPETMRTLIKAYGQVRPNLLLHAKSWPTAEELDARVYSGQRAYGKAATGADKMSEGAEGVNGALAALAAGAAGAAGPPVAAVCAAQKRGGAMKTVAKMTTLQILLGILPSW